MIDPENRQGGPATQDFQKKLSRSGNQLKQLAKTIRSHALVEHHGAILGAAIQQLHLQTALGTSGASARFLLSLQAAMIGSAKEESAVGFIGKEIDKIQKAFAALMSSSVDRYRPGLKEFIRTIMQLVGLGAVYLASQNLGQWKQLFQSIDEPTRNASGNFYRELGVLFIANSGLIEAIFKLIGNTIEWNEIQIKSMSQIGKVYVLMIVLYVNEADKKAKNQELWESLRPFLSVAMPSIEQALEKIIEKEAVEEKNMSHLRVYIQGVKRALENSDVTAIQQSIEALLLVAGISKDALFQEIANMVQTTQQMAQTVGFITSEAEAAVTRIIQSA